MAFSKKTGGRDFKPGQSGNPNGRPKLPEDVKSLFELNKIEFARRCNHFLNLSYSQLEEIKNDPNSLVFDLMIASILLKSIQEGDDKRLSFFLDRLIGKPSHNLETKLSYDFHSQVVDFIEKCESQDN